MTRRLGIIATVSITVVGLFGLMVTLLPASEVMASDQQQLLGQLCDAPGQDIGANCNETAANNSVTNIMGQIINVASWIAGIVSTIVLVIAGMMYVFSGGSPEQTAKARSAIIYALAGLAVALAANVLVDYAFKEIQMPNPGP